MNLKPLLLVSAFAAVGAANAVTLAVFNFNDGGTPQSPANTALLFAVDRTGAGISSAALSSNFEATTITNFGGSAIGADSSDVAGQALVLQGGTTASPTLNNGGRLDLTITANAGSSLALSALTFAAQRTGTGFNSNVFSYSVNGGTSFVSLGTVATLPSAFALQTLDLTAIPRSNTVIIRQTLDGASTASGNNRFDNLVVDGTVQAVPEPASMAALGLGALALIRRRRASK